MKWRLIKSGSLDPLSIHTIYEAIAKSVSEGKSLNTLHICWPARPYVCVGIHQVVELEVDLAKCKELGLEVVRRQVGGGAVYLDPNQFFYHIIINKKDAPSDLAGLFETYLKPTVCTYRKFGLNAQYKPLNDVVINGKKVSGNGAATFGNAIVLVGNVILDFDAKSFASVLRVPEEKMRDKLAQSMEEWVSSLKKELGYKPSMEEVEKRYLECFKEIFGVEFYEDKLTDYEKEIMEKLKAKYGSEEWLFSYKRRHKKLLEKLKAGERTVKIMEGHYVYHIAKKLDKLIRLIVEVKEGQIQDIVISGDFFIQPPELLENLEKQLIGKTLADIEKQDIDQLLPEAKLDPTTRKFLQQIISILTQIPKK